MFRYQEGDKLEKGTYWNLSRGERMAVENESVNQKDKSSVLTLLLAPFVGLLYLISFPFVVLTTVALVLVEMTLKSVWDIAHFGWRPTEAYLAGKKKDERKKTSGRTGLRE